MLTFTTIPLMIWLLLALTLALFLGILVLIFKRKRNTPARMSRRPHGFWGSMIFLLRLVGFALLALFLILGVLLIYGDDQTVRAETAPAQRAVDLPVDLPFKVEAVTFNGNGVRLAGWYVPPSNGTTIILLHGLGGTRLDMRWYAERLIPAGYGVLMYDERASGESSGDHRSYGWEDVADISGALEFLKGRAGELPASVGIAGCSIGAQIALQGAIHYPEIGAVWADGPSVVRASDNAPPDNVVQGVVWVSNYLIDFMYEQRLGQKAPPPMIEEISRIAPRPVMLVGGGAEVGMLGSEAPRMNRYAAYAGPNAQVWVIDEAVHCDGLTYQPYLYGKRLIEFFNQAFQPAYSQ